MVLIKEIVQKALTTGYLSVADQNQMQVLLQTSYDSEDLDAFIILQRAVMAGDVKEESRTRKTFRSSHSKDKNTASNIKLAYQMAAEMAFAAAMALTMPTKAQDQPPLGA